MDSSPIRHTENRPKKMAWVNHMLLSGSATSVSNMKSGLRCLAICFGLIVPFTSAAVASDTIEAEARSVLQSMSDYLREQDTSQVETEIEMELIDLEGQKLQFISSGTVIADRPNKMHVHRSGMVLDAHIYLADDVLTVLGGNLNAYLRFDDQTSIEQALNSIEAELGLDAAGGDFFVDQTSERLLAGTKSGVHVGMTNLGGIQAHHLAFRGDTVDWQIWIADSDAPVPLKYIVTSKWITGAPQYAIRFKNWQTGHDIDGSEFEFAPPEGAVEIDELIVNEMGEITKVGE